MAQDRLKDYIPVSERIEQFYDRHPAGRILTTIVEHNEESGFILMRAEVYRETGDALPAATGHAYEIKGAGHVNQTSHIENCETGAVGRALANMGLEVKRHPAEAQRPAVTREPARIDHDIRAAQDILGKTEESLTEAVMRKFGGTEAWSQRPEDQREWLFSFLSKKVNERAAEAR